MKKICILSAVNIKHMTMISFYTEKLKRDNIDFDIIYMDKYGIEEEFPSKNKYVFENIINPKSTKLKKIIKYLKFRKFAINILENNQYDFIIVWNDLAIFMFADYLSKKYKRKYSLNIRDYLGEKNKLIYNRFKKVIDKSAFTTISSEGFKSFLPPHNYLMMHSYNSEILKEVTPKKKFQTDEPIKITFIGNVRFFEINKKLLDYFKNDMRFKLQFYGTNASVLEDYAKENGILNVEFHDSFQVKETPTFIERTDLVNNIYGNKSMSLDYAVSIKLYYGIYTRTPILVVPNTYMAKIIEKYKIGYVIENIDLDLPDKLFHWYNNLNFKEFDDSCKNLINEIKQNNNSLEEVYQKFIYSEN